MTNPMGRGVTAGLAAALLAWAGPSLAQGAGGSGGSGSTSGQSGSTSGQSGMSRSGSSGQASQEVSEELQEKLQELHAGNQMEIQLGQLALQKAQHPRVKQFAQQMVDQHEQLDRQLTQQAQSTGVTLTGEKFQEKQKEAQSKMQDMQAIRGAEFDKAYMEFMVEDHDKDVEKVKDAAKQATDDNQTQIASTLHSAEREMSRHLMHARQVEESLERGQRQGRRGARSEQGTGKTDESAYPPEQGTGTTGSDKTAYPPEPGGTGKTSSDEPAYPPGGAGTGSTGKESTGEAGGAGGGYGDSGTR